MKANTNVIIPKKNKLTQLVQENYPAWVRIDKQRGTNCAGEMFHYIKDERNIRLFVKKSFLKWNVENFEADYKKIKTAFRNIIPNQAFLQVWGELFAFCAPIDIKIDIFEKSNYQYLLELLCIRPRLRKQISFFIKKFESLGEQWNHLDLYGTENLVVSDDDRLFYLDSFLVFHKSMIVSQESKANLSYLKHLLEVSQQENEDTQES